MKMTRILIWIWTAQSRHICTIDECYSVTHNILHGHSNMHCQIQLSTLIQGMTFIQGNMVVSSFCKKLSFVGGEGFRRAYSAAPFTKTGRLYIQVPGQTVPFGMMMFL